MSQPDRTPSAARRPVALVTGVGRTRGIGAGVATGLAAAGWDIAFTYWNPDDQRMPWGTEPGATDAVIRACHDHRASTISIQADLADPDAPDQIFTTTEQHLRPVAALIICHCESVDSSILDTTIESFDRHFAVNTRATWLLIQQLAHRFTGPFGTGRIVSLTSDHTVHNVPYGASKGAMDRITLAAAAELAHLGITANVINPGPIDTGWMSAETRENAIAATPLQRAGTPADTANLVSFLCSPQGQWINGQLLTSNGGWPTAPH